MKSRENRRRLLIGETSKELRLAYPASVQPMSISGWQQVCWIMTSRTALILFLLMTGLLLTENFQVLEPSDGSLPPCTEPSIGHWIPSMP